MSERDRPILRKMHSTIQEESDDENIGMDGIYRIDDEKIHEKFGPSKALSSIQGKTQNVPFQTLTYTRLVIYRGYSQLHSYVYSKISFIARIRGHKLKI